MLADTERRAKGVRNSRVCATDTVLAGRQISTRQQAERRQEDTSVVAEAKSDLAGIGSLSKGSDAVAGDLRRV